MLNININMNSLLKTYNKLPQNKYIDAMKHPIKYWIGCFIAKYWRLFGQMIFEGGLPLLVMTMK